MGEDKKEQARADRESELERSLKVMLSLLDYYRDDIDLDSPSIDEINIAYDLVSKQ